MKRIFPRSVSRQIAQLISTKSLLKINTPVFHPFYHVVSDENLPHILNYNYRNIQQFKSELDFFLKYFKPVSLEELMNNPGTNKKVFHISFDDGLKECAEIIAPILWEKGIPATFFVNPGFVDNKALFHKYKASLILTKLVESPSPEAEQILLKNNLQGNNILNSNILQVDILNQVAEIIGLDFNVFLKKQKPYLTTQHLLQLKNEGFSIGAHSSNHPEFWQISKKEQINEVRKSVNWVSEKINPEIKTFAFPFSDSGADKSVLQTVEKENICDITFGTAGVKYDEMPTHFQRFPVEQPGNFEENIKTEFVYFKLRKIIGKATVKH